MHLSGAILPGSPAIAVISIVWVNKGAFKSQSWKATTLARMVGWKVIGSAVHSPAAENIAYEHLGKNQFAATGSGENPIRHAGNHRHLRECVASRLSDSSGHALIRFP